MDYTTLANELIQIRASKAHMGIDRSLSKSVKGEMFILGFLKHHGNSSYPKELSQNFMVSTARMAVILKQLEKKELIIRTVDEKDNRQVIVTISEKGIEKLNEFHNTTICNLAKVLEALGPKDADEYVRLHKKFIDTYRQIIK